MIEKLRKEYFQKSKVFLYPLLKIPKGHKYVPIGTYVAWAEEIYPADKKFLCVYTLQATDEFYKFENKYLLGNEMFSNFHLLEDNTGLFVFNYNRFNEDYIKFLAGRYSTMSEDFKRVIVQFFKSKDIKNIGFHHVNSYLYPDFYFGRYAQLLGVDKDVLVDVGELCPPVDIQKETLKVKKLILNI
jgi:hypothetical protein